MTPIAMSSPTGFEPLEIDDANGPHLQGFQRPSRLLRQASGEKESSTASPHAVVLRGELHHLRSRFERFRSTRIPPIEPLVKGSLRLHDAKCREEP
jgi:hypothetical protein